MKTGRLCGSAVGEKFHINNRTVWVFDHVSEKFAGKLSLSVSRTVEHGRMLDRRSWSSRRMQSGLAARVSDLKFRTADRCGCSPFAQSSAETEVEV